MKVSVSLADTVAVWYGRCMTTEEPAEPLELTSEERELVLERRKRIADKLPIAKRFRVLRRWVENREAHG